ncbi:hypothetical protein K438DRAFT_1781663 [Mycena galopus ATCC 62051]|nr:hypothetical protein K438DRAFT_1781663 [Mycena galopus ATCC 62051]
MPAALLATFPSRATPVTEFLALQLPDILDGYQKISTQTHHWFSLEPPNCDPIPTLWSNSIPALSFLRELENDYSQKWMNGAISVLNPQQKSICLPLFAVAFYREIHRLREAQDKWRSSVQWAQNQFTGCDLEIFARVSWNVVHPDAPVLGIYRYGSVSGRHESFTDAETVDGLSYVAPERNINIFQHIVPPNRTSARSLALFTHAPISEFVYLLTGVGVQALGNETYSLTGGDSGWERWQALTSRAVYRILDIPGFDEDSDNEDEEEEEYEEPEEGSSGKKRKAKPPRGALKRKRTGEKKSTGTRKALGKRQKVVNAAPKPRKKVAPRAKK